jgi:hypothetical protein
MYGRAGFEHPAILRLVIELRARQGPPTNGMESTVLKIDGRELGRINWTIPVLKDYFLVPV